MFSPSVITQVLTLSPGDDDYKTPLSSYFNCVLLLPCMTTCSTSIVLFFFNVYFFIFLALLGLHCCTGFFSLAAVNRGYSLVAIHGLLIAVASLDQNTGFRAHGFQQLQLTGSRA